VAIVMKYPNATIESGEDVMKYDYDGKVIAVDSSLAKVSPEDIESKYSNVLSKQPKTAVIKDSQKLAKALKSKIGVPKGPVYWTGPTNDASKLGAADIWYKSKTGEEPISLKFGKGQLKNLGLENIGNILLKGVLKDNENLVDKVVEPEYMKYWDSMTRDWLDLIYSITEDDEMKSIIGKYLKLNWDGYQAQRFNEMELEGVMRYFGIEKMKKTEERSMRYLCRKTYENKYSTKGSPWTKITKEAFNEIFGKYFEDNEDKINKNLKDFFQAQMSISDNEMWYGADGGKKVLYVPSKEKFESISNKLLQYSFKSESTPSGYTITLFVTRKGAKKSLAIITVIVEIRWSKGQMNGKPVSSSKMFLKIKEDEWNQVFTEKAMFIK
jgi:hypothetical protein